MFNKIIFAWYPIVLLHICSQSTTQFMACPLCLGTLVASISDAMLPSVILSDAVLPSVIVLGVDCMKFQLVVVLALLLGAIGAFKDAASLWLREPSSSIVCFSVWSSYFSLSQGHSPKIVHLTVISIMWEMYLMAFSSICLISHLPRFFWCFHISSQRAWKQVIFMYTFMASITMVRLEITIWTWKLFPSLYGSWPWRATPSEPLLFPFETRADLSFSSKRYIASLTLQLTLNSSAARCILSICKEM